ncbi:MAG: FAD-dependent oxidoreductase [Deltaproteobacteria bacterium]|jgi:heterodisulfide reductase subunit A-like polyferredoxin|nr:FAD-dependent oxidoreductase [Deltaproteobacteria bacterium]
MKSGASDKVGAVLVVGGGIAGIQAALDLAGMGFYVHLLEKNPAIGGRMAQLDKVFPTNDCSMCIISPKLNDVGAHVNIDAINNGELLSLEGEPGNFRARIRRLPRFLDDPKCTACGDCAKACPVEIPCEFNEGLDKRKVPHKSYAQAYPNAYSLTKKSISPCVVACPAHVNAHGYVSLAAKGRFQEALETILDALPLPGTLGRICAHPCESECRRGKLDEPLDIKNIKRLVSDKGDITEAGKAIPAGPPVEGRVAIVGSGPAGLSAAYHLKRRGISSVIFEKEGVPGGALRLGIPDYRLPPEVLDSEIAFIKDFTGTDIRLGMELGKDFSIDSLFGDGFGAVFLAMGAHGHLPLGVPGENSGKLVPGVGFLRRVNLGERPDLKGKRVLVLGAGNVAMDAARCAVRLGAAVDLAYRRGRGAMPAWPWEVGEAEEEGVRIITGMAPIGFAEKAGKISARLARTHAEGSMDDRGARLSIDRKHVTHEGYDLVISATGQRPSTSCLLDEDGVSLDGRGRIEVDRLTFQTGRPGVFAGGDAQLGPALAIDAVAAGKEAALSISRFLAGEPMDKDRPRIAFTGDEEYQDLPKDIRWRKKNTLRKASDRVHDFEEFDLGLDEANALEEAGRCAACGACCLCYRCVKACLPGALTLATHSQGGIMEELRVGAVVLASGFAPYDPQGILGYRYEDSPNIMTSLEFERVLSASGPFQGHMARPSDKKEPKRIAWVQCVGSRDTNGCDRKYCSSVCCMYAMKEAAIAMEHAQPQSLEASVFYMDIRSHGKDFEKYYERAKAQGVRFVRSRVHTLTPFPDGDVGLEYVTGDGRRLTERFDMAVLSIGLSPPKSLEGLAKTLGLSLNEDGFVGTLPFDPVGTGKDGVYACGAATEPKDIPSTVVEASAAAEAAAQGIRDQRFTMTREREYPGERDVTGEIPRIGVFVCHCGINIASVVDVEEVARHARTLPFVELAETNLFTCSADTQDKIKDAIKGHNLNRVVVASCSPRTHEAMFRETLAQAGLNKFLFEMANIRDQDSWVHQKEPEKATAKAKDLMRGAVAKAAFLEPAHLTMMGLTREALVVGGGAAGMGAALSIANLGFRTHLVERDAHLGGNALKAFSRDKDIEAYARALADEVTKHPLIELHLGSRPLASTGFVGNFETRLEGPLGGFALKHGVTVLAPGGMAHEPRLYGRGEIKNVLLQKELGKLIKDKDPSISKEGAVFAFIQCAGSRVPDRPYCSKVCCTNTLDCALSILDRNPTARVFVLFRDMRSYGFRERKYEEARKRGVVFIRYEPDNPPEVTDASGKVRVTVMDHVLNRPLAIDCDCLTLASGIDPVPMKEGIVGVFKGQLNAEGFLQEAHMKLRPVDLATEGQFMAGLAHYPKPIEESLAQARAAAAKAAAILARPCVMVGGVVAAVDRHKCAACCTCVRSCPFNVPGIVPNKEDPSLPGHAHMEPAICQGCGVCVGECPGKAIKLHFFTDEQLLAKVGALAEAHDPQGASEAGGGA